MCLHGWSPGRFVPMDNRLAMTLCLYALGAICVAYGAYVLYGWWAAPIPVILVSLMAWQKVRSREGE